MRTWNVARLGPRCLWLRFATCFASFTLNHELKAGRVLAKIVFLRLALQKKRTVLWSGLLGGRGPAEQKRDVLWSGIFWVMTFQNKTGRFVAKNFSRTRDLFVEILSKLRNSAGIILKSVAQHLAEALSWFRFPDQKGSQSGVC